MLANQVNALNEGFTPSSTDIERAKAIVSAFDQAIENGGATASLDGQLIDSATAGIASGSIQWSQACEARDRARDLVIQRAGG